MNIDYKCFADLADRFPCDYRKATTMELADASTVRNVMRETGISETDVKIVFVNGKLTDVDQSLHEGDTVALVPATGGM